MTDSSFVSNYLRDFWASGCRSRDERARGSRRRRGDDGAGRSIAFTRFWQPALLWTITAIWASLVGCSASTHATRPARLGQLADLAALEAVVERPGPIRFERVSAANWTVARSGLINLDHPRAREAGLTDGSEPIEVFFYVLEHPTSGDYLVDSGVAAAFRNEGGNSDVSFLVEAVMNTESLEIQVTTAEWLATRRRPLAGVFLTHIHLDHVMGLPDIPAQTPIYVGPGETTAKAFLNLFSRGTIDRMLARPEPLKVWEFAGLEERSRAEETLRVTPLDVFGDGSLWALHVPGHTPGSTAFLVRTPEGPRLLVGDTSHTRWGWENDVEPGKFTADAERNADSLAWLRDLVRRHPAIEVHLGHQRLPKSK